MFHTNLKNYFNPHVPLGPSSLSMGNGPGGTAPGPFPLIVILRGGAVPPNSGAVPPPLYITIRGNGPGAVPLGPFPMDKLDGPSGMCVPLIIFTIFVFQLDSGDKKISRKEKDERILWKKNEVAEYEATTFSIFYNNALFLAILIICSFYIFKTFTPVVNYVGAMSMAAGIVALLSTGSN